MVKARNMTGSETRFIQKSETTLGCSRVIALLFSNLVTYFSLPSSCAFDYQTLRDDNSERQIDISKNKPNILII